MAVKIITLILIIVLSLTLVCFYYKNKLNRYNNQISFKESLDLTELPIVTFYHNENKLNFLLDTGSNDSHIASNYISMLTYTDRTVEKINMAGLGINEETEITKCKININYKSQKFDVELNISDHLNAAFDSIKNDTGVQIHGILGTKFMERYKYVIDFYNLTAYKK